MDWLWVLPAAVLAGGLYFLVRAFIRTSAAMREVKEGLVELNKMGPRLQKLAGEMSELRENIEEKRRQ